MGSTLRGMLFVAGERACAATEELTPKFSRYNLPCRNPSFIRMPARRVKHSYP